MKTRLRVLLRLTLACSLLLGPSGCLFGWGIRADPAQISPTDPLLVRPAAESLRGRPISEVLTRTSDTLRRVALDSETIRTIADCRNLLSDDRCASP